MTQPVTALSFTARREPLPATVMLADGPNSPPTRAAVSVATGGQEPVTGPPRGSPHFGLRQQLVLAVVATIVFAALTIGVALYVVSERRSIDEAMHRSEEMTQAASMAFATALARRDEVVLDAYVHELKSRRDLAIEEIYVLDAHGRVAAHSMLAEYGKRYPVPALLASDPPVRLSESVHDADSSFQVRALLQAKGRAIGVLGARYSLEPIRARLRSELKWIGAVTLPLLALAGFGFFLYGRRLVARLDRLQEGVRAFGREGAAAPVPVTGADEIGALAASLNRMMADLTTLRQGEQRSTETIAALNRDLEAQLERVKQLKEQIAEENAALREQLKGAHAEEIIGANGSLRQVIEQARQLASMPVTVLVSGESGTGKELLARFLHDAGSRREAPFVSVNCAALPVNLIESELFGHEKGAFTGAVAQKIGKFELAQGGTLFLDEVGELPPEAQAKLLRALQQGEIQRVGGERVIRVDTRVVAATNRNLQREVEEGRFRADLYYRLNVVQLRCPALRERREDIPVLAQHFINLYSERLQKTVVGVTPSALERLVAWSWPGNIRELENTVARAVALATTQVLGPDDFPSLLAAVPAQSAVATTAALDAAPFDRLLALCGLSPHALNENGWDRVLEACERICLEGVLPRYRNQKEAAQALGLTPTKIHRLIRKYRLKQ